MRWMGLLLIFWLGVSSADILRSFKIIIQNSTNAPLAVNAYSVLRGTWAQGEEPEAGQMIPPESTAAFTTESTVPGVGTAGTLYLSDDSEKPIVLSWSRPWAGHATNIVESKGGVQITNSILESEDPDNLVWILTITAGKESFIKQF